MYTDVNVPLYCLCKKCVKEGESVPNTSLSRSMVNWIEGHIIIIVDVLKEHVHILNWVHVRLQWLLLSLYIEGYIHVIQ